MTLVAVKPVIFVRHLVPPQQPHLARQGASSAAAISEVIWRINVIVDGIGVVPVSDIVKPRTELPAEAKQRNPPFQRHVQGKEGRVAHPVRNTNKLLVLVYNAERETITPVERIGQIKLLHQRQDSPRDNTVGCVPGKRPSTLRAKIGIEDVEIQNSV